VSFGDDEVRHLALRHQTRRVRQRAIGSDHHDRGVGNSSSGDIGNLLRRRRTENVEIGDDAPRLTARHLIVPVRSDEHRVDTIRRHHPGNRPEGRVERARDESVVHGVRDLQPV